MPLAFTPRRRNIRLCADPHSEGGRLEATVTCWRAWEEGTTMTLATCGRVRGPEACITLVSLARDVRRAAELARSAEGAPFCARALCLLPPVLGRPQWRRRESTSAAHLAARICAAALAAAACGALVKAWRIWRRRAVLYRQRHAGDRCGRKRPLLPALALNDQWPAALLRKRSCHRA